MTLIFTNRESTSEIISRNSPFQKSCLWSLCLILLGRAQRVKTTTFRAVFFFVVNKIFEKYLNERYVKFLEKTGLISIFKYGFKASYLTVDLLIIAVHRAPRAFNFCCAARDIDLDIYSTFISGLYS